MSEPLRLLCLLVLVSGGCASASGSHRHVLDAVRERLGPDVEIGDGSLEGDEREAEPERLAGLLSSPVGPDEAVAITLLASPEIRAAMAELGIARAAVLSASAPPNPELDIEARFGREGGAGDEVESHLVIDLAQLVVAPLRRAAEESGLHAAELESADTVLRITFDSRVALIEAQRAEARRELAARVVDATRAARDTAIALYEAGNVPRLLVASETALHQDARLMLAQAELEALEAREQAVAAMGLFGADAAFPLAALMAPGDVPELEDAERRAVAASLRLASIEETLRAIEGRHGASRLAGILPGLRAGVSMSYAENTLAFGPAVNVELPVFDQHLGATDALEAELRVTAEEWTAEAIRLRSLVRRARNRLRSYAAQARFCEEELLPARRAVLAETLLQYDAMAATPFAILAARRAEIEAGLTCIDARADHALARAAFDLLVSGGWVELDPVAPASLSGPSARGDHE